MNSGAKLVVKCIKEGVKLNHRRLIVVSGAENEKLIDYAAYLVRLYVENFVDKGSVNLLYVYHAFYEDGVKRRDLFREKLKDEDRVVLSDVPYHKSVQVMGSTYDVAILDLVNNLEPNDLGRLVGVVRGGGILVFLTPRFEDWPKITTRFQEMLLTYGYTSKDVRRIFIRRFINKIMKDAKTTVINADMGKVIKPPTLSRTRKKGDLEKTLEYPEKSRFPRRVYKMALTQDQINVLRLMEVLYEKPEGQRLNIVITADRGRGKSCAVGIGLAALAYKLRKAKGRCRIIVTAPSEPNIQSLFNLAFKTLRELRIEAELIRKEDSIIGIKAKGIEILYLPPIECLRTRGDIIAVDEAAALQVPMLFAIHRRYNRAVFSSTIHGYEGAGRGFSIRFLSELRKDPETNILEYEMSEPIRYSADDPVENWLFETLLLDAEPAALNKDDLKLIDKGKVNYYSPNLEEFFLRREEELRQFIGIYVMAHYRNNSNDLGMMMDAPHHTVRALRLPSGKIVTSVELAEEGGIPEDLAKELAKGAWIAGNIIPDRYVKHYRILGFAKMKGWRIVRIATHPDAMDRGLGSIALKCIEDEARRMGYDWVGAGFGVTWRLLNFWLKNGYVPIHISPDRNPVSGEYTVIVVKPISKEAERYIITASKEFRRRLINSLHEPYHDLDIKVARMLLSEVSFGVYDKYDPMLTEVQKGRLISYSWGSMTIENCMDAVIEIARTYFYNPPAKRPKLSDFQELVLIVKVLQAKSWRVTCEQLKKPPPVVMDEARRSIRILTEFYLGFSEKDLSRYFVSL